MEEELKDSEDHLDDTQVQESVHSIQDASPRVERARSTLRPYRRSNNNSAYQKTNIPKDVAPTNNPPTISKSRAVNKTATVNKVAAATPATETSETNDAPVSPRSTDLLILKNTVPQNYKISIEILDIVELETSDEDEVIEVPLPPKPTIIIESSDEDELIVKSNNATLDKAKSIASKENKSPNKKHSFNNKTMKDGTPSKKKRKKKLEDLLNFTPVHPASEPKKLDNIFATPTKAKNKKQKKHHAKEARIRTGADLSLPTIEEQHFAVEATPTRNRSGSESSESD